MRRKEDENITAYSSLLIHSSGFCLFTAFTAKGTRTFGRGYSISSPAVNQLQSQSYKQNYTRYRSAGRVNTQSSSYNNNNHCNNSPHKSNSSSSLPRTPCWQCGVMAEYSTHTCSTCNCEWIKSVKPQGQ